MDLMIDLETLGTSSDCPVISIGAVYFDVEKKQLTNDTARMLYTCLDIQDQLNKGRVIDASTIKWWMGQKDAAKKVFKDNAVSPKDALMKLCQFVKLYDKVTVWGNGSTFDISILESMFAAYGIACPWNYYNVMDLRTFKRFVAKGATVTKQGVGHNALDDAISQAKYIVEHL